MARRPRPESPSDPIYPPTDTRVSVDPQKAAEKKAAHDAAKRTSSAGHPRTSSAVDLYPDAKGAPRATMWSPDQVADALRQTDGCRNRAAVLLGMRGLATITNYVERFPWLRDVEVEAIQAARGREMVEDFQRFQAADQLQVALLGSAQEKKFEVGPDGKPRLKKNAQALLPEERKAVEFFQTRTRNGRARYAYSVELTGPGGGPIQSRSVVLHLEPKDLEGLSVDELAAIADGDPRAVVERAERVRALSGDDEGGAGDPRP